MGIKVLSCYDGMACGHIAFTELGKDIDAYKAYEIDKYAIKTATHNFPDIEEMGDVFKGDFTEYGGYDWLVGGSPCTFWSISQSSDKRETTASGIGWELFNQYVRALHEAKPKYFLYENNKSMSKEIRAAITETFGFEPICINSALVSAQNRQRLYWVGIRQENGTYRKANIEQPEDRGILLKDILETGESLRDKIPTIDANYFAGGNYSNLKKQSGQRLVVGEPVNCTVDGKAQTLKAQYNYAIPVEWGGDIPLTAISCADGKKYSVYKVRNGTITIKGKEYPIKLEDGYYIIRKLTVKECMRSQQIPEWYDFSCVSNTQAYKMLGNGWSVEVIKHLISSALKDGGEK